MKKEKLTKDNILIMVLYLNIDDMDIQQYEELTSKIYKEIESKKNWFEKWHIVPVKNQPTKLECLNPTLLNKDEYKNIKKLLNNISKRKIIKTYINSPKRCIFCGEFGCYGGCLDYKESTR